MFLYWSRVDILAQLYVVFDNVTQVLVTELIKYTVYIIESPFSHCVLELKQLDIVIEYTVMKILTGVIWHFLSLQRYYT